MYRYEIYISMYVSVPGFRLVIIVERLRKVCLSVLNHFCYKINGSQAYWNVHPGADRPCSLTHSALLADRARQKFLAGSIVGVGRTMDSTSQMYRTRAISEKIYVFPGISSIFVFFRVLFFEHLPNGLLDDFLMQKIRK